MAATEPRSTPIPLRILLRPLWAPLRQHWGLAAATIFSGWGKFILPMGVPLLMQHLIDRVLDHPGPEADRTMLLAAVVGVVLIAVVAVAVYFRTSCSQRLAAALQHRLRRRLFHHIQRLSMPFFHRHHAGALGSRVSSDINHAGVVVEKGILQTSMDGPAFLVNGGLMWFYHPPLATVCFVFFALKAWVMIRYSAPMRRQRKSIQDSQSTVTGRAAEIFSGISVVKAFSGEHASGAAFAESSQQVHDLQQENSHLQGSFQGLSHGLMLANQIAVVLLGGWLVLHQPGSLSKGELVAFLMLVGLVAGSVQRLIDAMLQIQDGLAALERIHDVLTVLPDPADRPDAIEPKIHGAIELKDVVFGYRPDEPVIRGLSFRLEAGRSYALVGPSGGGKSSLAQLILRFYDPQQGAVLIDGNDLRSLRQAHYRSRVACVLQDPIIFSSSVRDNIAFASEDRGDPAVEAAARMAQAHEFIQGLPEGYDTRVGERGVALSGGQRQRIAIARALMRDPCILILDEATSALDTLTERSIQQVIDHLHGSRTVLVIAHRLSTVRAVDEILVIDSGRLVEHGSYDELIARGGAFAKLAMQEERAA